MNTVIIGNSGSGKTWLAQRLAQKNNALLIHLDEIFWMPGGFDEKRSPEARLSLVQKSKEAKNWVVEGVFGELASHYLQEAELVVWLDTPWPICAQRIKMRSSESNIHMNREQSDKNLQALLIWAEAYYSRTGFQSRMGHEKIFNAFNGKRERLHSPEQVLMFLKAS